MGEIKEEPEDANAAINIGVCIFLLFFVCSMRLLIQNISFLFFIQVVSSNGDEIYYKIKRSTEISKLQAACAHFMGRNSRDVISIRSVFLFSFFKKIHFLSSFI
jgi:hypothetical protein